MTIEVIDLGIITRSRSSHVTCSLNRLDQLEAPQIIIIPWLGHDVLDGVVGGVAIDVVEVGCSVRMAWCEVAIGYPISTVIKEP